MSGRKRYPAPATLKEPRHCQCGCTERRDYFGNYDLCPLFERALEEYADAMEQLKA